MEPVLGCQTYFSTVVLKFTFSITFVDGVYGMHNTAVQGELGGMEWRCKHRQGSQGQAPWAPLPAEKAGSGR